MRKGNEKLRWTDLAGARPSRVLLALLLLLGACATPPPADDPDAVAEFQAIGDPLEPTNRALNDVNSEIGRFVLGPLGYGYRMALPETVRSAIRHVIDNAASPVGMANHLLQGKPCRAADTLVRLLVNTTFGLAGMNDVAAAHGVPAQETDFGLTLGNWGVSPGPYLLVPVMGSSNSRDLFGRGVDLAVDPMSWIVSDRLIDATDWARLGIYTADTSEHWVDQMREINRNSLDPYAVYRSLYRRYRANQVERSQAEDSGTVCGDPS